MEETKMKANELLKAVMNGCIEIEQSGYATGSAIVEAGPFRYFGSYSSGNGIRSDRDYIYYYGEEKPIGMPEPTFALPFEVPENDWGGYVYLWEVEE